jgi:hypothetical protein
MQGRSRIPPFLVLLVLVAAVSGVGATGADAAPSFSVVSTSTTPDPTKPGSTATITTSVKNSGDLASGIIVDMEIFNSGGSKVFQQYTPATPSPRARPRRSSGSGRPAPASRPARTR